MSARLRHSLPPPQQPGACIIRNPSTHARRTSAAPQSSKPVGRHQPPVSSSSSAANVGPHEARPRTRGPAPLLFRDEPIATPRKGGYLRRRENRSRIQSVFPPRMAPSGREKGRESGAGCGRKGLCAHRPPPQWLVNLTAGAERREIDLEEEARVSCTPSLFKAEFFLNLSTPAPLLQS
ncbi:hypothetical protein CUR178_00253 [Leishmania enriettii]|uniref:Uncharacterized protein n=1 Tax=Leishmania enriettii TaxID=5663 RepID=A0A836KHA6_LEIEN|nr:hypothetical protein CUR178_00253 [Leishmania enriettii]